MVLPYTTTCKIPDQLSYKILLFNGNKRSKCDNNKDILILFAFTTIQLG